MVVTSQYINLVSIHVSYVSFFTLYVVFVIEQCHTPIFVFSLLFFWVGGDFADMCKVRMRKVRMCVLMRWAYLGFKTLFANDYIQFHSLSFRKWKTTSIYFILEIGGAADRPGNNIFLSGRMSSKVYLIVVLATFYE